jgi:hypothetical protein
MIFVKTNNQFSENIQKPLNLFSLKIQKNINDENIYNYILYIGKEYLTLDEFKINVNNLPAYIEVCCDLNDNTIIILYLNSTIKGKGYATLLLFNVIQMALEDGIINIQLDDVSDNYRKQDNIYTNIGLKYEEEDSCEMIGTTEIVMSKLDYFKKKYNWY